MSEYNNNKKRVYNEKSYSKPKYKDIHQQKETLVSDQEDNCGVVIGRNAVRELLKSDRSIDKIMVKTYVNGKIVKTESAKYHITGEKIGGGSIIE